MPTLFDTDAFWRACWKVERCDVRCNSLSGQWVLSHPQESHSKACPVCNDFVLQAPLLVGSRGTGKSAIISKFLAGQNHEQMLTQTIAFSYVTAPIHLQTMIEASHLASCQV